MRHSTARLLRIACCAVAVCAGPAAGAGVGEVFESLGGGGSLKVIADELVVSQSGQRNRQEVNIGSSSGHGSGTVIVGGVFVTQQGAANVQTVNIGTVRGTGDVFVHLRNAYVTQQGTGLTQSVNVGNQY